MGSQDSYSEEVFQLLENVKNYSISIVQKHRSQNELQRLVKLNPEVLESVKNSLKNEKDFICRKVLLDCHLALRNVKYLVDLITKVEEPELTRYALRKYKWIFKNESAFSDNNFFTDELLPVISFVSRNTIIWQLAYNLKDETKCEELYKAIHAKVGPSSANTLLPACSSSFVQEVIRSEEQLKFTNRQLRWLLSKHPNVAIEFLKKEEVPMHPQMMKRVVQIDPVAFVDIYEKGQSFQFGTSSIAYFQLTNTPCPVITKCLAKKCLDRVLENPTLYEKILHKPTLYKVVGKDVYIKFLVKAFPKSLEVFKNYDYAIVGIFQTWIDFLPAVIDKSEFFKTAFDLCYGVPLIDCPECISQLILKNLSEEDRDKISEIKLGSITQENSGNNPATLKAAWIACKPTEKSVPELKKLISQESDHFNRQQLISHLVQTCSINKEPETLNQICKYYADRHRNERQDTHVRFISDIANEFDPSNLILSQESLHYFVEIFKIYFLGLEKEAYVQISTNLLEAVYFSQLDHCLSTSWILPILQRKELEKILSRRPFWTFDKNQNLEPKFKSFIELMAESIDCLPLPKPFEQCKFLNGILTWCQDWNKRQSTRRKKVNELSIKNFPTLETKFFELLDDPENIHGGLLSELVDTILLDPVLTRNPTNPIFKRCLEVSPNLGIILHFIKYDPVWLEQNWLVISKFIFETTGSSRTRIVDTLKKNGFNWNLKQLSDECNRKLESGSDVEKVKAVSIISMIWNSDEFLLWVAGYTPTPLTIRVNLRADDYTVVTIRKAVCDSLKNINCPSRGLSTLLHFCAGDYLKLSLGSLTSIVLRSDLQEATSFLLELSKRAAVSVKKHGIRLMSTIALKEGLCNFLTNLWAKDAHPTTRHVILKELINRVYDDETAWNFLKIGIQSLSPKETDSLLELMKCQNIPNNLCKDYLNIVWDLYRNEKFEKNFHAVFVTAGIQNNIHRLSTDWVKGFLAENFFTPGFDDVTFQHAVMQLFIDSLLNSSETWKAYLTILDENLKKFCPVVINDSYRIEELSSYKLLDRFIRNLCQCSFQLRHKKFESIGILFEEIQKNSVLSQESSVTFSMNLLLKLTATVHSTVVQTIDEGSTYGKVLGKVLDEYIGKFGQEIYPFFASQLQSFIQEVWHGNFGWTQEAYVDFAAGFLDSGPINSNEKKIIILKFLPPTSILSKEEDSKGKYKGIMDKISKTNSNLVQIHYSEWILKQN